MDQIVDKLAALGVPGLVLVVTMSVTGWVGAAAFTTALAALGGPLGMMGGLLVLGLFALISKALADFGFEALFKAIVDELQRQGKSKEDIQTEVESYPISYDLKLKIRDYLQRLA